MTPNLQPPEFYLDSLRARIKAHKIYWGGPCDYTKDWRLSLEKHTNRHRDEWNYSWGWYEIRPIGFTVGYWDRDRDDLKGVDIKAWNEKAKELAP